MGNRCEIPGQTRYCNHINEYQLYVSQKTNKTILLNHESFRGIKLKHKIDEISDKFTHHRILFNILLR